jgi:hypothetical protein
MPLPYDLTTHDGKRVDWLTKAALLAAEKRLGYTLTVYQGSYNAGAVKASGGTHDGGGAVDLAAFDHERKVRVLRSIGFAAWYRPELPGVWGPHIHAVLIGNLKLSDAAKKQVVAYRDFRDGLAGNKPDSTWHPNPIPVFQWPEPTKVQQARALLREALARAKSRSAVKRAAKIQAALDAAPER